MECFAGAIRPVMAMLMLAACVQSPSPPPTADTSSPGPVIEPPPPKPRASVRRTVAPMPPLPKPAIDPGQRLAADWVGRVHAPLDAYRQEPPGSCASKSLMEAKLWAGGFASSFERTATVEQRRLYGTLALDVADAARERGCPDEAKGVYDGVLRAYVDGDYEDLRQRAEQGLLALPPASQEL